MFFSSGCRSNPSGLISDTPTLYVITAALPATLTPRPSSTPLPPSSEPTVSPIEGTTTTQLNVRAAPSASADILGLVGIFVKVQIIGKDEGGTWYQIIYPVELIPSPLAPGSNNTGWLTSAYVQVNNTTDIPVIRVDTSGTPMAPSQSLTQDTNSPILMSTVEKPLELKQAAADGDSAEIPAVNVNFSPLGSQSFSYSSDVSFPEGDAEDWVQFNPYAQTGQPVTVSVILNCSGNSTLGVELHQNSSLLQSWENLLCGQTSRLELSLFGGPPYSLRLMSGRINAGFNYVHYQIVVQPGN